MKAVPDNFYSTPGPFNFNHYLPAQETNFEDKEVEVVVEEEWYDGDIPANLEEDDDFEDHNDTTLRAIPLGDLKFDPLQAPETSSISTVATSSHIWGNALPYQPSVALTSSFDFTSLSLDSHTESQDIHQYACATPPPLRPQHIHSTATQHSDNLVEADPFNITPLTSQYLVPSPYPANDLSVHIWRYACPPTMGTAFPSCAATNVSTIHITTVSDAVTAANFTGTTPTSYMQDTGPNATGPSVLAWTHYKSTDAVTIAANCLALKISWHSQRFGSQIIQLSLRHQCRLREVVLYKLQVAEEEQG
ncbi:hypothetical protein H0H87_008307 [Tephrocybe sp. NHM501043]|nr:hypothetical protein H0H87_008307 [Tephrocybe sp. NHM501043]